MPWFVRVGSYCEICREQNLLSYIAYRGLFIGTGASDKKCVSMHARLPARCLCTMALVWRFLLDYNALCSGRLSHSHTGSYDFSIVRLVAIDPWCDRSAIFATISSSGRIPRYRSLRVVALSRTMGEYRWQEPSQEIVGVLVAINDRCTINRDGRRPMVRSIDRCLLRPVVRAIVAYCDRSYEHSWYPGTERTINRGTRIPMVQSLIGCNDRSHDQS